KSFTPCTFTDTGLADGTQYSYAVIAENVSGGLSAFSNVLSQFTDPGPATNVVAIPDTGNDSHVTILFAAPAAGSVDSYAVLRGTTPGGPYGTTIATGLLVPVQVDDNTTVAGTQYDYVVSTKLGARTRLSAEAQALTVPPAVTG